MRMLQSKKSERGRSGSASLEAALTLPLVFLLILALAHVVQTQAAEAQLRGALFELADEVSLALVLADQLPAVPVSADMLDFAEFPVLPDGVPEELADGLLADMIRNGIAGPPLAGRLATLTAEERETRPAAWKALTEPSLYIEQGETGWYGLHLNYKRKLFGRTQDCRTSAVVPDWSMTAGDKADPDDAGEGGPEDTSGLWELDNFSRGKAFRALYGGNLPEFFPTIACFENGTATMIKSWDLTAPSYAVPGYLERQLSESCEKLHDFAGGGSEWAAKGYDITASDIRRRELLIIVPENSPAETLEQLRLGQDSFAGIDIRIETSGESRKHAVP